MFELTIPTGFTQVTDLSVLSLSGSRSANYFFADDVIRISDKVYSQLRPSTKKTDDGKPIMQPVYYALVNITHKGSDKGYDKLLPLAAFRRLPKDSETFLATAGDYDTAQMSRLIDLIAQDCKSQGIETLTPDKLDAMKVKWGEAYGDR